MKHNIIFDLDGTLTDSGEGIIKCASLALSKLNLPVPSWEEMRVFVGPPLRDTFQKFGVHPEDVEKAVEIYRSRYVPIGLFENTPYPGIAEMLAALKNLDYKIYVATAKPEPMAQAVLEHFQLAEYFDCVCGATLDGTRGTKEEVIAYLLKSIEDNEQFIMVGDTVFDVIGAQSHGIPTVGVSWGYGNPNDLQNAGAIAIANSAAQLLEILTTL